MRGLGRARVSDVERARRVADDGGPSSVWSGGAVGWDLASGRDDDDSSTSGADRVGGGALTLPAPVDEPGDVADWVEAADCPRLSATGVAVSPGTSGALRVLIEENRSWEKEMTFREPVGGSG